MPTRYRFPLMAMGMFALLSALGTALVRLGWEVPLPNYDMLIAHGSLMVCGFLGTLISLERAVALNRPWAYLAPLLTGAGGLSHALAPASPLGPWLIALGSLGLALLFAHLLRRHPALHTACLGLGALAYLAGNLLYALAWPLYAVVPWWVGFLLLTISGERLELSRLLLLGRRSRTLFLAAVGLFLSGLCLTAAGFVAEPEARVLSTDAGDLFTSAGFHLGARLIGLAMLGLAAWLLRFDVARRTIRTPGLTRFIAVCLLSGYLWLGLCGLLGLIHGGLAGGLTYDALLHAFFLGFVFSMIFGHAPVILPAVLGVPIPFRPAFYLPLALLHATLALRVTSDLLGWAPGRAWGGLLNVLALLSFLINTGYTALRAPRTAQVASRG
jgi:hypothetical protein